MLAMYVSWWTLALALAGVACLIAAASMASLRRSRRLIIAALGIVLLSAWVAADLIGPGPALFRDKDPALDPGARFYEVGGIPYRQRTDLCRTEAEMRRSGIYEGAIRLKGSLVPVGHIVGWLGGPALFRQSGSPSTAPIYAEVGADCYVVYVTIVG